MDLTFTPQHEAFRLRLREWLQENLPPGWGTAAFPAFASYQAEVEFLRDWQLRLYRAGWCGFALPKEYGGAGGTLIEQAIYTKRWRARRRLSCSTGLASTTSARR